MKKMPPPRIKKETDMAHNPVSWFEIPVKDMIRAKKFYTAVFNVELNDFPPMEPMAMSAFPGVQSGVNTSGALMKGNGVAPSTNGTVVYFETDDLDGVLGRVTANGGKILVPRTPIGEYGFFAHFQDIDGNRIGLHSMK